MQLTPQVMSGYTSLMRGFQFLSLFHHASLILFCEFSGWKTECFRGKNFYLIYRESPCIPCHLEYVLSPPLPPWKGFDLTKNGVFSFSQWKNWLYHPVSLFTWSPKNILIKESSSYLSKKNDLVIIGLMKFFGTFQMNEAFGNSGWSHCL